MKTGIGIIGCGAVSRLHIESYKEIAASEIRAVSDVVPDYASRTGEMLGIDSYANYMKLLERDDIDAVSICTPSGLHKEIAVAAARAKKHVIVEKPLEVTLEKVDEIINACRENGVKLACIFNNRYRESYMFIKNAVSFGRFGRIINANAYIRWYRKPEYYGESKWRGTWALDGGGALMNQSIHYIDLLLWFAGEVKSIYASAGKLLHKSIEAEDTAAAVINFKSGALGSIVAGTSMYPGFPARIEITGERGSAIVSDRGIDMWEFEEADCLDGEAIYYMNKESDNNRASDPMAFSHKYHKIQIEGILNSFKAGKDAEVDGFEARKSVELIQAAYRSAETGEPVFIQP